jgi:hypothetical protein
MKLTKQLLIIIIFIIGPFALYTGYLSFADPSNMLEIFHITPMPGMDMLIVFLGLYFLTFGIIYLFDAYLLFKRRQAGRTLASLMGFTSLVSGIVIYMKYKQFTIESGAIVGIVEAIKGAVILLLASISKD